MMYFLEKMEKENIKGVLTIGQNMKKQWCVDYQIDYLGSIKYKKIEKIVYQLEIEDVKDISISITNDRITISGYIDKKERE